MEGVGTHFSLDTLMTGTWRRFRGFLLNLDKKLWFRRGGGGGGGGGGMTNFFG